MQLFQRGWIFPLVAGILLIGFLNVGISFLALKRLEIKAGAPLRGQFLPRFFRPAFTFKEPNLQWQGRFQVYSGTFVVQYDPFFLLPGSKFRVHLTGRNLGVRLLGELAQSQGLSDMKVDWVEADFAFSQSRTPEIDKLHIRSPQLQFHLVKSGKN